MYPLTKLGYLEWQDGRRDEAKDAMERSVALAREFGDAWWAAGALHTLADWALEQGDLRRAGELCAEGTELYRDLGDRKHLAYCVALLACIAAARGEPVAAGRYWGALEALEREGHTLDPDERARYAELVHAVDCAAFSSAAEAMRTLAEELANKGERKERLA